MAITLNRGEWSESYAFLRLLAEGFLYAADDRKNRLSDMFFPIIKILHDDTSSKDNEYKINRDFALIEIYSNDEKLLQLPVDNFRIEADHLFEAICNSGTGDSTFEVPRTESFMKSIYAGKLKAGSKKKSDIDIQIHDIQTGIENIVGFSVKSDLGSPPTLLNPGKTTNFVFKVEGLSLSDIPVINSINTRCKIIDRMDAIQEKGGRLIFCKTSSKEFYDNLIMIDSQMHVVVAEMLKGFYCRHTKKCSDLAEEVACINPLNQREDFYSHKIKELLCASALGMTPATKWNGRDIANGGYVIVKTDGDVVAYHIYNRDFFKDYLLRETQLVQPGTTRYEYCSLYEENGNIYIKLCLQIRFL